VAGVNVHAGYQVRGEVDDLLQVLGRDVEQVTQPARHSLEVPDVRDGCGELDVPHPLTTHLGTGDFYPAAFTDDALEAHPLVFAAVALPVPRGTEDLLAEQAVFFRLEGAVVDGFGLFDLAVRPTTNIVSGGQADTQFVEEVNVEHFYASSVRCG